MSHVTAEIKSTKWEPQKVHTTQLAIEAMDVLSEWFIQNAIKYHKENGGKALAKKIANITGFERRADLIGGGKGVFTSNNYFISSSDLGASNVYYRITNNHREKINGVFYDYWTVYITGFEGTKLLPQRRCIFYLTKSNTLHGKRSILKKSEQFFHEFPLKGKSFKFPTDNLYYLYVLEAWKYPHHFKNYPNLIKKKIAHSLFTGKPKVKWF